MHPTKLNCAKMLQLGKYAQPTHYTLIGLNGLNSLTGLTIRLKA